MTMMNETKPKSKAPCILGCLGGGCLSIVVAGVALVMWFSWYVGSFLQTAPSLPVAEVDQAQVDQIESKVKSYVKRVETGGADEELVLTEDELNLLITKELNKDPNGPRVKLKLDGDIVHGEFTLPTQDRPPKYLNGKATFTMSIEDGHLDVRIKEIGVRGRKLPEFIAKEMANENMAKDYNADPANRKKLKRVKKIEIRDGKVYVELKPEEE